MIFAKYVRGIKKSFIFVCLLIMSLCIRVGVYGETIDQENGNWDKGKEVLYNTSEAQVMIRIGDIDNFGFEIKDSHNNPMDPFTGMRTKVHSFPFKPEEDDPDGTDRIMVVSGYDYNNYWKAKDGYTGHTGRNDSGSYLSNIVRGIELTTEEHLETIFVEDIYVQMFVDDFQAQKEGVTQGFIGNNVYSCELVLEGDQGTIREPFPELDLIINNLNQHGPVGNIITFRIPERCLYLFREGNPSLVIDDKRANVTGDGFAIDFVKLLINQKEFKYNASVRGVVRYTNGEPAEGVNIEGAGVNVQTDENGRYLITGIAPGQVVLRTQKNGYMSVQRVIEDVHQGNSFEIDFEIEEAPKPAAPIIQYSPEVDTYEVVTVTIDYPMEPSEPIVKEYKIDEGEWKSYFNPIIVNKNCTIRARSTDIHGNISDVSERTLENLLRSEIDVRVWDSKGVKYTYSTEDNEEEIGENFDGAITISGDGYVNFNVSGRQGQKVQYQFIRSGNKPSDYNEELWIDYNEDSLDSDVDIQKEGFLNQRGYDVNHLSTMSDVSKWENREEVYKSPFMATRLKDTRTASSPSDYGVLQDYMKENGDIAKRWESNSVFMRNMYIGNDYKEASKFWGYIKVPQSGAYKFGAWSDDGCRGVITIDGESSDFVDRFRVQGSTFSSTQNTFILEAGRYYPIFIEYFNWGGGAHFELAYKFSEGNSVGNISSWSSTKIPREWLYPSFNISPGEFADTIFKGSEGVKFPKKSGDYYIATRTISNGEVLRRGSFGPFTVNGNSDIFIEKYMKNGDITEIGREVQMEFSIKPDKIFARSTFKEDGEYKNSIVISKVKIEETIPNGLEVISQNSNIIRNNEKVTIELGDLVFNLVQEDGELYYKAEELKTSLIVRGDLAGTYTIGGEEESFLSFEDVNGSKRQIGINSIELEVIERTELFKDVERILVSDVFAQEDFTMEYSFGGEAVILYRDEEEVNFEQFYYEETFPPKMEIVQYPQGLVKSGNIDTGYTLSGDLTNVVMEKVSGENWKYRLSGEFEITLRALYKGEYNLTKGVVTYNVDDWLVGTAFIDEIAVEAGERYSKLRILEIQPEREFVLNEEMFRESLSVQGNIDIDQMSVTEFNGNIDKINGKYDIVYIGNSGEGYTERGREAEEYPGNSLSNGDIKEFYSERDITNRRGRELQEFINSGQLTIVNGSMFQNQNTKIYGNMVSSRGVDNLIEVSDIQESLKEAIKRYSEMIKRPKMTLESGPQEYLGTDDSYQEENILRFTYSLENKNIEDFTEGIMEVTLSLDINGDGYFSSEEVFERGGNLLNGSGYIMQHVVDANFTGIMPWKLEVQDLGSNAKNFVLGYTAFFNRKEVVRVLQLTPNSGTDFALDDTSVMNVPLNTEKYEIDIVKLTVEEFENNYPNVINKGDRDIRTRLNGNYDMVILGFKDVFGGSDLSNEEAVVELKDFIKTGQSVMFTHDTFMYHVDNENSAAYNLTREFRDVAGQSRYLDINNQDGVDFTGESIIHDPYPHTGSRSYGFSDGTLHRSETGEYETVNSAVKINDSVITKYPYVLNDVIPISDTHYQYFQLNLEDEEVTPWFNMNFDDNRRFDSRNYYYTYSRGNITYSGTGHSVPDGVEEQKLFINTMLKAVRNSNRAPTIEVYDLYEGRIQLKNEESFQFSIMVDDVDGDKTKVNVFINDTEIKRYDFGEVTNGETLEISLLKDTLRGIVLDQDEFDVRITVQDERGAQESLERRIRYISTPSLKLYSDNEINLLLGDRDTFNLAINGEVGTADFSTTIEDVEFTMEYDNQMLEFIGDDSWSGVNEVQFSPQPSPSSQSKIFQITPLQEGKTKIRSDLEFSYSNIEGEIGRASKEIVVNTRKGKIFITTVNGNDELFQDIKIKVIDPKGVESIHQTDINGGVIIDEGGSGRYTLEVIDLDEKFYVLEGQKRYVDLSFEDFSENIGFKIVDTTKTGLQLEAYSSSKVLVGDIIDMKLKAIAFNQNESVETVIHEITGRIITPVGLNLVDNEQQWSFENIDVDGEEISNRIQFKNISLRAMDTGEFKVKNTLEYMFFGDIKKISNSEKRIHVKRGSIRSTLLNSKGEVCSGVRVFIKDIDSDEIYSKGYTDNTGVYVTNDVPTGDYEVIIPDFKEFTDENEYKRKISISYDNPHEEILFRSSNDTVIINNGIMIQGEFVSSSEMVVGFGVTIGTEFKSLGKENTLNFSIDGATESINFKLYKIDENGRRRKVGDGVKVYLGDGEERVDDNGLVRFEGDETKALKVELKESEDVFNHYTIVYYIKSNGVINSINSFGVNINDVQNRNNDVQIVELPVLD